MIKKMLEKKNAELWKVLQKDSSISVHIVENNVVIEAAYTSKKGMHIRASYCLSRETLSVHMQFTGITT